MRVLVTGSRDWHDVDVVFAALSEVCTEVGTVVVHGDCPTGADRIASDWCQTQRDIFEEKHPANWKFGKSAGPIRNQHMVDLGADICLAFPLPESRGTRHCMTAAAKAGIPVRVVEQ